MAAQAFKSLAALTIQQLVVCFLLVRFGVVLSARALQPCTNKPQGIVPTIFRDGESFS